MMEQQQSSASQSGVPIVSSQTVMNSVVAGYAAGIAGTLIGHPLDSAKVWLQTQQQQTQTQQATASASASTAASSSSTSGKALQRAAASTATNAANSSSTSNSRALFSTNISISASSPLTYLQQHQQSKQPQLLLSQIRRLYNGVAGPLVTVGLVQSIHFAIYDALRRSLYEYRGSSQNYITSYNKNDDKILFSQQQQRRSYLDHDRLDDVALSAVLAGSMLAVITSPLLIIKTQQQVHNLSFSQAIRTSFLSSNTNSNTSSSGNAKWRFSRMYVGFGPHLLAETLGRAVYFCTYEALKRYWTQKRQYGSQNSEQQRPTMTIRMASAGVSGVLCWACIFPLDALRCRLYASAAANGSTSAANRGGGSTMSAWKLIQAVHRQQSWSSLYRGFGVTVLRAGPVAAAVLPIYDCTLEYLNSNNNSR